MNNQNKVLKFIMVIKTNLLKIDNNKKKNIHIKDKTIYYISAGCSWSLLKNLTQI